MTEQTNTPILRFKGFNDEWSLSTIGALGDFYYGKSAPKWSITEDVGIPCIRYGELYTKFNNVVNEIYSYTSMPKEKLRFSKGGEILIPRVGEDPLDFAKCVYLPQKDIAIGEMISVYNTKENPLFLTYYFNTKMKYEFAKRVEGASVSNLYYSYLEDIKLKIPDIREQQKLGVFFSKLDRQIELEEKKLELLEQQKRGYMQKIFSQQLRFKDENGNDYPEWKKKKLDDVANYRRGSFPQPYGNKKWYDEKNGEPFVQVVDVDKNMKLHDKTKQKISDLAKPKSVKGFKGDIVVTLQGSIGRVAILQYDAYIDRTLLLINSFKIKMNKNYFKYVLYLLFLREKERAPGGTIKTITKAVLSNFEIDIPTLEEQNKIGMFFNEIDNLIELQNNKINHLKQRKQGLLQKMFV